MPVSAEMAAGLAATLRATGRRQRFRRGHALFVEGDHAERVLVLEHGRVLISIVAPNGREVVLGICGPGELLGEMSALDGEPRSATATAIDEVEVTVAPVSVLLAALERPDAAREVIRTLAARLRDGDRRRLEFAALGTLGRVAWRIMELTERFGERDGDDTAIDVPLSQEQLASWCGSSWEATVKALAQLRKLGIVTTGRQRIVIRDLAALHKLADGVAQ
ncbi:MAG: Crp/Fnr family transcriptional regulator [Solirubrobacteraceae bacterium]